MNEWTPGPEALRLAVAQARHLNPFLCGNGKKGAHVLRFQAGLIEGQRLVAVTEDGDPEWTDCAWEGGSAGQNACRQMEDCPLALA